MKRLSIIILAIAALVAGCTREDDITPITPSQPDQIHIKRVYVEQHLVIEAFDTATLIWDTLGQVHTDKYLSMEWFWNGDRLDSVMQATIYDSYYIYRFTYDNKGLLTRYDQYLNGVPTGDYVLFFYDADGRLSRFEQYDEGTNFSSGIIDSYVGNKISHMRYTDNIYDVDINYTFDDSGDNVTEMLVNGLIGSNRLHSTYTYVHDDHINPFGSNLYFINLPREPYKWMTANNVLTEFCRTIEGDMEERDTRTEYLYRYEGDLPVEMTYESHTGTYDAHLATTITEYYEY